MPQQQPVNSMAPIVQDQPRRARRPKADANATANIPELPHHLATPRFIVPPGTEPRMPGAASHQFGFHPPVAANKRTQYSIIDPTLRDLGDVDMEAEEAELELDSGADEAELDNDADEAVLNNGADDDSVSHKEDNSALADRNKDTSDSDEEVAAGFEEEEMTDLESMFTLLQRYHHQLTSVRGLSCTQRNGVFAGAIWT